MAPATVEVLPRALGRLLDDLEVLVAKAHLSGDEDEMVRRNRHVDVRTGQLERLRCQRVGLDLVSEDQALHSRGGQAWQQPLGILDASPLIQMERPVLLRAGDVASTEADPGPGVSGEPFLIVRRRCALGDEAIGRFDRLVPASDDVGAEQPRSRA